MPIVTISRGTLSGGRTLAECLANTLGYPCVGREILQAAAKKVGASEETLIHHFEEPPGHWTQFTVERKMYSLAVQAALAERCITGELVYHGLAGQFLLRGLPGVLRIRLIAPMAMRLRALASTSHRMTHRAAEEFIRQVDRDRAQWVRFMYGEDVEDPSLYDLTLNLRGLSVQTACATIAEAAAQPQYQVDDEAREQLEIFAAAAHEGLKHVGASN